NYVKGSIYLNEDELNRYECIPHMTSDYPTAFLLGSEYRNDLIAMSEKLKEVEVEHILVDPLAEHGKEKPHCFVANERVDPVAAEAFSRLTEFLKEKTK
ncbi:MAG: hypothetical protein MRZ65_05545, partial [Lachnospiraceae bacterium]|nr:hypothetical protein [Lachnospiraceae bacterium]